MASGHRYQPLRRAILASAPTLLAGAHRECVSVPMFSSRAMLERDVVGVDDLNPSRRMAHRVLGSVKPAHCTVIRPHNFFLSIQVTLEVLQRMDHCEQFLAGPAVSPLAAYQRFAGLCYYHSLPPCIWERTAPMPTWLASMSRYHSPSSLGNPSTGALQLFECLVPSRRPHELRPLC